MEDEYITTPQNKFYEQIKLLAIMEFHDYYSRLTVSNSNNRIYGYNAQSTIPLMNTAMLILTILNEWNRHLDYI